jgi:hypothetical protein
VLLIFAQVAPKLGAVNLKRVLPVERVVKDSSNLRSHQVAIVDWIKQAFSSNSRQQQGSGSGVVLWLDK